MDKLQPVIKHRFWILVALVPPLCIFAYYSANGAMRQATADRVTALDGVISGIPQGTGANPTWTDADKGGLAVINAEYKSAVDVELVRVWEEQQARMTWPRSMQRYVPAEYLDAFPQEAGFTYKDEYPNLIAAVHASVEPITPDARGKDFSGKVWLDQKLIPRHTFGQLSVESDKIWEAQEDLWYLQLLFDAIRNVNRSSENAAKAAIRKVYKIDLVGGTGESSVKASASPMGNSGAMPVMHSADMPMMDMPMSGGEQGPGRTSGLASPKVSFSPAEEFGSDVKQASQGSAAPSGAPSPDMMMMGGGNRGAAQERIRYIKLDPNAKYRERGFYLSVLIDQKKIADFLVELSNADWPIRIVRFHVGPNPEKPGAATSGGMMDLYGGMDPSMAPMPAMEAGPAFDAFDPGAFDAYADAGAAPQNQMGPSRMVTTEQMAGLFTHPDLVQLDLCGVITFYNPPKPELLAAVQAKREARSTQPSALPPAIDASLDPVGNADPAGAAEASTSLPGAAVDPAVTDPESVLPAEPAAPVEPADEAETPADATEPAAEDQPATADTAEPPE